MATRRTVLAVEHVQALNLIDVDFQGKDTNSKAVLRSWKAYHAHLSNHQMLESNFGVWLEKTNDKLFDLLEKVAIDLGFEIDDTHLRNVSYFPEAHSKLEEQQREIREKLILLLRGEVEIPVKLIEAE